MGVGVLSVRAMARRWAVACLLALLAGASRAESDPEMLKIGERALCAASHSRIARTGNLNRAVADDKAAGRCAPPGYNVFLVFGVRPCSGVLVSDWHVVTSAYCTEHAQNGTAFLGGHKYQSPLDLRHPEVMLAIVTHVYYFNGTDPHLDHDVAVGKLNRKFEEGPNIGYAELSMTDKWEDPAEATIMGFGETFEGDTAHELRSLVVTLECGGMCAPFVNTYRLGDNALCGSNNSLTMCWGDMGGAVVDSDGKLVALVSYKTVQMPTYRLCAVPVTNTFFMYIGYYREWILSVINPTEEL